MTEKVFRLTEDHLTLLRNAYVRWEPCEAGAPAIDCKRPYGNGDVAYDVVDILGWEWDVEANDRTLPDELYTRAMELHSETVNALQIVLQHGLRTGLYLKTSYKRWDQIND